MRHRIRGKKLGRKRGHRRELIKNLVTSLILYEKIITTAAKGKVVKSAAEKILKIGQGGNLAARRLVLSRLNSKLAAAKIFEDLNPKFKGRNSGFVRLVKIDNRKGDNASLVILELLIKHKKEVREARFAKGNLSRLGRAKTEPRQVKKKSREEPRQKRGFWDRLRGKGHGAKEVRAPTKKTIERTTSK
ncbi:MAG: large subunit ribosomal protein L17 [Candidatus Berkelbacteria bacterium Licking1014_96]|uniref:50S ribosomal protein L17 n=1 Tax=Candidatus Berkelbacteria bacterium Licking1014_96 TaxID=2017149 RepID=A0A554LD82_9BACT|nr:MAG: large subunit ribosomal protein L17 [Candidatus Berkelbacteria bacterium Licking1014_96]